MAKEIERQLKNGGTEPFEHKGTLDEYLDKWLTFQKYKVAERTYEDYKNYLRLHVRPIPGKKKLSGIKPLDVQSLIDQLQAKNLSPRTVKHAHSVLSQALKQAVKWKILHYKPLLVKAELPDIRLYDLRHSCATLLLAAGENPKVVSERPGHSTIVLTMDTYTHVLPTMQQAATDRLEEILERR